MQDSISVFQIGSRMHYAVPEMLCKSGRLSHFYTDIVGNKGIIPLFRLIPFRPNSISKLLQRKPNIPKVKITHFPKLGLKIGVKLKHSASLEDNLAIYNWYNKEFQVNSIKSIGTMPDRIYSFNGASLELFKFYPDSYKILEQTIAPFFMEQKILESVVSEYSDWVMGGLDYNSKEAKEFGQREIEECKLADKIVCASDFVRDSLVEFNINPDKIFVVPYGVELSFFKRKSEKVFADKEKINVITVGRLGLRKGAHLVKEIAERCADFANFTWIGPNELSNHGVVEMKQNVNVLSSVPKEELLNYYEQADVFLLPSLCEGSATVVYEAMAMELPCVVSNNSGTIVEHGVSGYVFDHNNVDDFVGALKDLFSTQLRSQMSASAKLKSKEGSKEAYLKRLLREI